MNRAEHCLSSVFWKCSSKLSTLILVFSRMVNFCKKLFKKKVIRDSKSWLFALKSNKEKIIRGFKILDVLWLYWFSVGAGGFTSNPVRRWPSLVHPLIVRCRNSSVQPTARSNVQTALTGGPRREGRCGVSEMCKFLRACPPLLLLSGYLGGRQRIPSVRGTGRRPSLTEDEFHPLGRCCGALLPQWVTGPAVGTGGCIGQGGTGFGEGEGDLS